MSTIPAISTTPSVVYFWDDWSNWSDYSPSCFSQITENYPSRERFQFCVGPDRKKQSYKLCADDFSDRVETQKQKPTKDCLESIFNNTDPSLMEEKMKFRFSMPISLPWSDNLTITNSTHSDYLSQLCAREISSPLKNVRRTRDLSNSTALSSLDSSWKILFYSVRVISFSKQTQPVLRQSLDLIEVIFETIFDVLAAADEDNDSLTLNAQTELIKGLTSDIKEKIDEKLTISDKIEGGHTIFVNDVNFQDAELEDVFVKKCDSNYVNMNNSCEKTCALTPCQDSKIFSMST